MLTGCQVLIYCIALCSHSRAIMLVLLLLSRTGIRQLYLLRLLVFESCVVSGSRYNDVFSPSLHIMSPSGRLTQQRPPTRV